MARKLEKYPRVPEKADESREVFFSHQLANMKRLTVPRVGQGADGDKELWCPFGKGVNWVRLQGEQVGRRYSHLTFCFREYL